MTASVYSSSTSFFRHSKKKEPLFTWIDVGPCANTHLIVVLSILTWHRNPSLWSSPSRSTFLCWIMCHTWRVEIRASSTFRGAWMWSQFFGSFWWSAGVYSTDSFHNASRVFSAEREKQQLQLCWRGYFTQSITKEQRETKSFLLNERFLWWLHWLYYNVQLSMVQEQASVLKHRTVTFCALSPLRHRTT